MITHSVSNHPEPRWQRKGPPSAPSRRQETRPKLAGVAPLRTVVLPRDKQDFAQRALAKTASTDEDVQQSSP